MLFTLIDVSAEWRRKYLRKRRVGRSQAGLRRHTGLQFASPSLQTSTTPSSTTKTSRKHIVGTFNRIRQEVAVGLNDTGPWKRMQVDDETKPLFPSTIAWLRFLGLLSDFFVFLITDGVRKLSNAIIVATCFPLVGPTALSSGRWTHGRTDNGVRLVTPQTNPPYRTGTLPTHSRWRTARHRCPHRDCVRIETVYNCPGCQSS
ncbi:hypothetical protein BKA83DRAFT_2604744 [Pisolithus microcarpus]|nr:hypothetical protein BKA83DRAFT_2604744 [Pisolithus microcarpus]